MTDPPTLVNEPPAASLYATVEAAGKAADVWLNHEFVGVEPASLAILFTRWDGAWLVEIRRRGYSLGWLRE